MEQGARFLIVAGLVLTGLGVLLAVHPQLPWLGKLPGDLRIERPGFRLYLPLTSCLLVSGVVSALLWLASRWR